jgi:hypothetical protein
MVRSSKVDFSPWFGGFWFFMYDFFKLLGWWMGSLVHWFYVKELPAMPHSESSTCL